jgi:biopolymer transport protein ExbD
MKFRTHQPEASQMQLAPMIDIVFLLLTFFIVTWQFSRSETDMRISVPSSQEGAEPNRSMSEIVINVDKDGRIFISSQELTRQQLQTRLEAIARVNKSQPVRLRGDAGASYQTMVEVIDIISRARIWNISFATERPRQE